MIFYYLDNPSEYKNDNEYIAVLDEVESVEQLFKRLKDNFNFPDYFGNNWNALNDCLLDFSWTDYKVVTLVVSEFPDLFIEDQDIFMKILINVTLKWQDNDAHDFKVIFPKSEKEFVESEVLLFLA